MPPLNQHRKHYYNATLTRADSSVSWTGKGPTEAAALAAAQQRARKAGETIEDLIEQVESLVGPAPRTFAGNDTLPE